MSEWTERFENHPVHKSLQDIRTALDNTDELAAESADSTALEAHARLRNAHATIARLLTSVDPELVPQSILNNIEAQLESVNQELQNFLSNKSPQHLRNAANNSDGPLVQIGALIVPSQPADMDGLRETLSSFRKSVGQHLRNVDEGAGKVDAQLEKILEELAETAAEISSQKGRLDAAIATVNEQFAKAEQERSNQWNNNVSQRQEQFTQETKAREEAAKKRLDEWESRNKEESTGWAEKFDTLLRQSQESADNVVEDLNQYKTEAEELVHIIATTGMAGGYQSVADKEARRALTWHIVGASAIAGLVGFAIYAFIWTLRPEVTWSVFSARVFVALSFGFLAAYSERQANRHAETERRNRRWQLVLASINPYLAEFPEDKQQEIKQVVAEKIFAGPEVLAKEPELVTPNVLYELLRMVLQNLTKK